jgi:GNAT superfamily N-acetyltransferase
VALIRPLEERDWQQVHDLVVEVARAGETYTMDVPASLAETQEYWTGEHLVVAVDGDTVLGSAKLGPNRPAQGSHVGTAAFMVGARARGHGTGRAMGEYAVEWLRSHDYRSIQFNAVVSTNAAAVHLWQSLGFQIIGTVPEAFRLPDGSYADLHVMYLRMKDSRSD